MPLAKPLGSTTTTRAVGVQGAVQGSAGCGCQGGVQPRPGSTGPLRPGDCHAAGDEGPEHRAVHGRQRAGGPHPAAHAVHAAWEPLGCPAEESRRQIQLVPGVSIHGPILLPTGLGA